LSKCVDYVKKSVSCTGFAQVPLFSLSINPYYLSKKKSLATDLKYYGRK